MHNTPKFKFGDKVWFDTTDNRLLYGKIVCVDGYGSLFGDEPYISYDIFCFVEGCTYEHVAEMFVHKYKRR